MAAPEIGLPVWSVNFPEARKEPTYSEGPTSMSIAVLSRAAGLAVCIEAVEGAREGGAGRAPAQAPMRRSNTRIVRRFTPVPRKVFVRAHRSHPAGRPDR